ncbi:BTB and MATH domain-containing protein 43-like [Temnothorax curvispinosus]|uniref:BTB and MATH domain-containing protein 43-like n=1 Tax=Temnothorax curvispinosus TaxID=300111 RepID=A0A6J1R1J7_9HYME|nr:BTB and MATH domain-containing protein 43-like [Temnothorax curvispinosus]
MEENQISDTEVQNLSTDGENTLEKEQTVSSPVLPSYIKSYSQTHIESTIVDQTWKIDKYMRFSRITNIIPFPSFLKIGPCKIEFRVPFDSPYLRKRIQLRILTNKQSFDGSCTTTIMAPTANNVLSSKFISGRISDRILLIEISLSDSQISYTDSLIIHCKFEIFHNLINKTVHMNLLPSSKEFSKDVTHVEDSTSDEFRFKDEESIKFIVGEDQYVISKKSLCAINSSYFNNICRTHEGEEKNMTINMNELVADNEVESFGQILLYILTGSIDHGDCDMLKELLTTAHKYDVSALKLTCENYLLRYITIDNAVELIQLAFSSNAKFLETHSASFIKFHIIEIRDTKEFRNLPPEDFNKIMELIEKSEVEISTHQFLLSRAMINETFTLAPI